MEFYSIPTWYHEGIADAFASRIKPLPFFRDDTRAEIRPLMDIPQENSSRGFYLLSHFALENLFSKNGESIITEILRKTKEMDNFSDAFNLLTGYDLANYHLLFEVKTEQITEILSKIDTIGENEAEKLIRDFMNTKGKYFNEATSLLYALASIYIKQERFAEALTAYEEALLYEESATIYSYLSEIALKVDQQKAVKYAIKAVELAKERNWNVEVFNEQLENVKNQINES
ncbi:hypothetical protein [Robertmurraya andreesenii]|uniref:Tetratricopeptide (TPR) repeat protein n=1 Tax=Anoxybacillus andreesenii TaxID=1325932 RepID=A0ABT9VAG2_9BACL|nr:hypothetical protein [Robertmurraya andreesenii]MDQ0157932.1 tetratricopeptide (TPR) repeat protein [Robertmurraya andreesenii]